MEYALVRSHEGLSTWDRGYEGNDEFTAGEDQIVNKIKAEWPSPAEGFSVWP